MHEERNIEALIVKYLQQELSEDEQIELNQWIKKSEANQRLFKKISADGWLNEELQNVYAIDDKKAWEKIAAYNLHEGNVAEKNTHSSFKKIWIRLAVAASVITCLCTAGYLMQPRDKRIQGKPVVVAHAPNDIKAPDKNRATITLANGSVVYLDSVTDGSKVMQAGVNIVKRADGQLAYSADSASPVLVYNTLYNPRGSKTITLVLSDGTKVWLNNETTLHYPVSFIGHERRVEIVGEAYFEVAKIPSKPFKVVHDNMEVEVLGTHFNINAYPEEKTVKTTLLEGKVKLTSGTNNIEITPGQQASYSDKIRNAFKVESNADLDKVMAWKEGMFQFDNAQLAEIMRQIGRWYNMDIAFGDKYNEEKFGGGISRKVPLSDVLQMLTAYGIKSKVEDNKITVVPSK